jgi:hypothetical protein
MLLKPKLKPTLHNAFVILSQPDNPTHNNLSGPPLQMDDDRTIMPPDPREHRQQRKIAWRQHIKQTLWLLRDSDDLFLDNSITLTENKWTSLVKADDSNRKRKAISNAQQALVLPNADVMPPTVWALHSTGRIKRSTRTSISALPHTPEYINTAATSNPS